MNLGIAGGRAIVYGGSKDLGRACALTFAGAVASMANDGRVYQRLL
jgi:hypothetical protein